MKLLAPFSISSRVAPALQIGSGADSGTISYVDGQFIIDLPDGTEHKVTGFNGPKCRTKGVNDTPELYLQDCFRSLVSFLSACADSRQYATRKGGDPMEGELSDLFPANVGEWAESVSDELSMVSCEIEESENPLILA